VSARLRPLACLVLLAPSAAWAGERAELDLSRDTAASSCPDAKELSDAVASRLGYEPFAPDAGLRVTVRFLREGGTLRALVEMRTATGDSKGARSLASTAPDCQELAEATALTISILLDPRSGLGPRVERAQPAPTPEEVPDLSHARDPTALTTHDTPVTAPRDHSPHLQVDLSAHATGSIGLLPSPDVGFLAGAGVEGTRWSTDLELRVDAATSRQYSGHGVGASFAAGEIAPCARFGLLHACGVVAAGAVQTTVDGTKQARQTAFMMLLGPRLGLALALTSWLSFDAHADVFYAPTETTVQLNGATLWSSSAVSALLGIGLVGRFP
jgi:hypothetical protein